MSNLSESRNAQERPDWGIFVGVVGLVAAFLIPLLQTNGVDVNWQVSIALYVVILATCIWSFLWHAVPGRQQKWARMIGSVILTLLLGSLGIYATDKQYIREHTDDLSVVRIVDVIPKAEAVNSPYLFQIEIENKSRIDLIAKSYCVVAKPSVPLKPFGNFTGNTAIEQKVEDELFNAMDKEEASGDAPGQDLPADKTVYAYCHSSWTPTLEELDKLHDGRSFTLYVAGRISIPSLSKGAHIDFDYCRTGSGTIWYAELFFGHNVPHVHF